MDRSYRIKHYRLIATSRETCAQARQTIAAARETVAQTHALMRYMKENVFQATAATAVSDAPPPS